MITKDLVAGRELDALVAEKVMGWDRVKLFGWGAETGRPPYWQGVYCEDFRCYEIIPDYSSSITDAWLVIERLQELRYDVGLYWEQTVGGLWLAEVYKAGRDRRQTLGDAWDYDVSAPVAICRAALGIIELEHATSLPRP